MSLFVSRLVASVDKSLPPSRLRSGIEKGFSIRNCESWTLHKDVCQALWFRRVKAEKTLAKIEPHGAVGAAQFFLCSQEQEPHTPFSWSSHFASAPLAFGVSSGAGQSSTKIYCAWKHLLRIHE